MNNSIISIKYVILIKELAHPGGLSIRPYPCVRNIKCVLVVNYRLLI